jgi:hypothetical protein
MALRLDGSSSLRRCEVELGEKLEEEWKFFWLLISNAETLSELSEVADRPHLNQALAFVPEINNRGILVFQQGRFEQDIVCFYSRLI